LSNGAQLSNKYSKRTESVKEAKEKMPYLRPSGAIEVLNPSSLPIISPGDARLKRSKTLVGKRPTKEGEPRERETGKGRV